MYTVIVILTIIASILLMAIVLVQNSKGGGLASGFSSGSQVMGVVKTTDILEKLTWGFAIGIFVLSISAAAFMPKVQQGVSAASAIQEQIDQAATPPSQAPQMPPASGQQQPAQ